MPLISTASLTPSTPLSPETNHEVYCGLDCCVTMEVWQELGRLHNQLPEIYNFSKALQGPYLDIMSRGFLVDQTSRQKASDELGERITSLLIMLNEQAQAIWGRPLNPRSPAQLKDFFYTHLRLPEVWIPVRGEKKLSTSREALEKLEVYLHARSIIACILAIRDLAKQREIFDFAIDPDRRFRASYNIAGTETGRPSSSENAFGTGRNAQNVAPGLRWPFCADYGWKLCVIDLEQVEARDVGFFEGCLFGDWRFLDACESGDLHTINARLVWPERVWTGDLKRDRLLAEEPFYREFSFRDMSKRGGHLSNYEGTAWMMARALKISQKLAEDFQSRYCRGPSCAYPAHAKYWQWIAGEIQTTRQLTTPFGRTRQFFGRPEDPATVREGIAFLPQSTTADRMNLGMWRVWKRMPQVQLLAQTYDSITFQFPEHLDEADVVERALELVRVPLHAPSGREYVVPGEAKVGWNWGACVTEADQARAAAKGARVPRLNPGGLMKWRPGWKDPRARGTGMSRVIT